MKGSAKCYEELRGYLETVPLVDCHDHTVECGPKYTDPLQAIVNGYFPSDVHSASCDADIRLIMDLERPLEERWPVFEKV